MAQRLETSIQDSFSFITFLFLEWPIKLRLMHRILKSLLFLERLSNFSHPDSVLKLWLHGAWFLRFCNQIRFEFQISGDWKIQTFFLRDLQLSKFGKWNAYYCWLQIRKYVGICYVGFQVIAKTIQHFLQFWAFGWINLNEYKGWSLFKSPSPSLYLTQQNWKHLHIRNRQYTEFHISNFWSRPVVGPLGEKLNFSPLGFHIETILIKKPQSQAPPSQSFKTISQQEKFDTWSRKSNVSKI